MDRLLGLNTGGSAVVAAAAGAAGKSCFGADSRGGGTTLRPGSRASIPTVHQDDDDDSNNEGTDAKPRWASRRRLGRVCVRGEREQLVLLQVPGLKELQAIVHRQAFLQTTTGDLEAGRFSFPMRPAQLRIWTGCF